MLVGNVVSCRFINVVFGFLLHFECSMQLNSFQNTLLVLVASRLSSLEFV